MDYKSKNITVFGWFNQKNFGDDLFVYMFEKILYQHKVEFVSPIEPPSLDCEKTDIVIFGGGDLINDFFINKFKIFVEGFKGPIYGIGLGIPYPSYVLPDTFNKFHYVSIRSEKDTEDINQHHKTNFYYSPDLVFGLPEFYKESPLKMSITASGKIKVGFFLTRTLTLKDTLQYDNFILQISNFINFLLLQQIANEIHFILFDTGITDTNMINDINKLIDVTYNTENTVFIHTTEDVKKSLDLIKKMDYAVCTKFHAHVLCTIYNIPYVSLNDDLRKVRCLTNEIGVKDFVIDLDIEKFTSENLSRKFTLLLDSEPLVRDKLHKYSQTSKKLIIKNCNNLLNMIDNLWAGPLPVVRTGHFIYKNDEQYYIKKLVWEMTVKVGKQDSYHKILAKESCLDIPKNFDLLELCRDTLFKVCHRYDTEYLYGFADNLEKKMSLTDGLKYIINEERCKLRWSKD